MKKLQYTTNQPSASTDYLAADNTWKTIPGGGGGVPYTGATADVDLGTHSLTADSIGIGTTAGAEKLHIDGGASTTRVKIDADNGVSRILSFRTDDVQRWALRVDGTESGSNSGADFQLRRYNDAGAHIDNPIAINRANGNITTSQNVNGASPTEMGHLSGVTSAIQTQINSKQNTITLTTTGTSGAATLVGSTLNIPQYAGSGSKSILNQNHLGASINALTTTYGGWSGATTFVNLANEFSRNTILPLNGTINNWAVNVGAQPATGSLVFTLRVNSVDTSMTITIAAGSVTNKFYNTTSNISVVQGDLITFKVVNNASTLNVLVSNSIMYEV